MLWNASQLNRYRGKMPLLRIAVWADRVLRIQSTYTLESGFYDRCALKFTALKINPHA